MNTGGPYHPAHVAVAGDMPGQQVWIPHPGVSLRNEIALRVFLRMIEFAGGEPVQVDAEGQPIGDTIDANESANECAASAFLFADAFIAASKKGSGQ